MTDTVEADPMTCSGCGDVVATTDIEGMGPCCHNLPERWRRGEDGLYNSNEDEDAVPPDDEDEDENEPPHCIHCGSRNFRITLTQVVRTDFGDGEMLYYDPLSFETDAECADCSMTPQHLTLEES